MSLTKYDKYKKYSIDELEDIILTPDDWRYISLHQTLTEDFIEKYKDKVVWWYIVRYQKLSYSFLERHLYKYPLYIRGAMNKEHIRKLQEKYPHKYEIDKLEYELNK